MKPKVRELSKKECQILVDTFFDLYHESEYHNQSLADKLYKDLIKRGKIWIAV